MGKIMPIRPDADPDPPDPDRHALDARLRQNYADPSGSGSTTLPTRLHSAQITGLQIF